MKVHLIYDTQKEEEGGKTPEAVLAETWGIYRGIDPDLEAKNLRAEWERDVHVELPRRHKYINLSYCQVCNRRKRFFGELIAAKTFNISVITRIEFLGWHAQTPEGFERCERLVGLR